MSPPLNLDAVLAFAIAVAQEAGQMIRDGQKRRWTKHCTAEGQKSNSVDLVTEIDKKVEEFITKKISEAYPSHKIIGEETYTGQAITSDPTWIARSTIHGFPMVATSIGLAVNGVPVVGVVYNPILDQMYTACKGNGAYLNGEIHGEIRLPLSGIPRPLNSLSEALIGFEFGLSRSAAALSPKFLSFAQLTLQPQDGGKMVHGLRDVGSAALNVCLVASGALDMHWEIGCWMWDVCAGICILTEAGGAVFGGRSRDLDGAVDAELLCGRKYLFIRDVEANKDQSVLQTQIQLADEFYLVASDCDL